MDMKKVLQIAKLTLSVQEQTKSKEKTLKFIQENKELFLSLGVSESVQQPEEEKVSSWTKLSFKKEMKRLRLTLLQKKILSSILKHKNSTSLEDIISDLKAQEVEVNTGSMVGGSLAGITKKCESFGLPEIFSKKELKKGDRYSIPEAISKEIAKL